MFRDEDFDCTVRHFTDHWVSSSKSSQVNTLIGGGACSKETVDLEGLLLSLYSHPAFPYFFLFFFSAESFSSYLPLIFFPSSFLLSFFYPLLISLVSLSHFPLGSIGWQTIYCLRCLRFISNISMKHNLQIPQVFFFFSMRSKTIHTNWVVKHKSGTYRI